MSEVVVVVVFRAKEGRAAELEAAVREAIAPTHAEPGCIRYALHQDRDDPDVLVLVERWRSAADLAEHGATPYVRELGSRGDLMAGPPQLHLLDPRPFGDPVKGAL